MAYLSPIQFSNSNVLGTTLNGAIVAGDNSLTLTSQAVLGCPTTPSFDLVIDNEIITVNGIAGNVCSPLSRGAGGTTPAGHANNAPVFAPITKGMIDAGVARIDQANTSGAQFPVITPSGLYAAVQNTSRIVGAVAPGVGTPWTPAGGPYNVGDIVVDISNATHIVCTGAGSPGTWTYSPSLSLAQTWTGAFTVGALTSSGEITAKDFKSTGIASLTNVIPGRFIGVWSTAGGGPPAGLTGAVGDFGFDANGSLWACITAGSPGTWVSSGLAGAQYANVDTNETTVSGAMADLATVGPSITMVTGTRVFVSITGHVSNSLANAINEIGLDISGATTRAATQDRYNYQGSHATGTGVEMGGTSYLITGLTPGSNTFKLKYAVNGGTGSFSLRSITVIPA